MAELSQETQAILDRLKAEGDLLRNSGTNSIKQVNIKLDRFQGLFDTISANISQQSALLDQKNKLDEEALERSRTQEQIDELNNQRNTNSEQNEEARRGESGDNFIAAAEKIGEKFTLKNMALMAAGGFVTYNLLKGFIEQGLQDNLLGMNDLKTRMSALSNVEFNPQETFDNLQQSIDSLQATVDDFQSNMDEIIDKALNVGTWVAAVGALFGAWRFATSASNTYGKYLDRQTARLRLEEAQTRNRSARPPRNPSVEEGRGSMYDQYGEDTERRAAERRRQADRDRIQDDVERNNARRNAQRAIGDAERANAPRTAPYDDAIMRQQRNPRPNFQTRSIRPALDGRRDNGQFASKDEIEQAFKDERMRRIFQKIVRGLGAIGIIITVVEMVQLYEILNSDASDEEKIQALGSVIGSFIGAAGGLTAGASVGAFFGPWGALIVGAIGAGLGAWAGSYIGEMIAKWAFDESVSSDDRSKNSQYINSSNPAAFQGYENLSQQDYLDMYAPGGSAYGINNTPDYMKYLDPNYNAGSAGAGVPGTSMQYGGRGTTVETMGERAAYTRQRQMDMLEAVLQVHKERNDNTKAIMDYLGITPTGSGTAAKAQILEEGAGGGVTTILNAPQNNVTAPVSVVDGGTQTSINSVTSMGGGSGTGPAPYGMTSGLVQ